MSLADDALSPERRLDALIALISDIDACKARRAELKETQEAADNSLRALQDKESELDAAVAEAQRLRDEAASLRDQAAQSNRETDRQRRDNDTRAQALDQREKALQQAETDVRARDANVGAKLTTLDAREKDLEAREKVAAGKLRQAQELLKSYDEDKHRAAQKLAS